MQPSIPYNVACMCMISGMITYCMANWGLASLEKTMSPTLNVLQLRVVLCLTLNPCENFFPFQVYLYIGVILIQVLFRQPCCWVFIGVASLAFLGDIISQQTFCGSRSIFLPSSFSTFPELLLLELDCKCISWGWAPPDHLFSKYYWLPPSTQ